MPALLGYRCPLLLVGSRSPGRRALGPIAGQEGVTVNGAKITRGMGCLGGPEP